MKSFLMAAMMLLAIDASASKSSYSSSKSSGYSSSSSRSSSSFGSSSYKSSPTKPLFGGSSNTSTSKPLFSSSKPAPKPVSTSYTPVPKVTSTSYAPAPKPRLQSSQGTYRPNLTSSAGARPIAPRVRYNTYSRPITRSPSWYHSGYRYNFRNSHYNRGYNYYPVNMQNSGSDLLTGALAGALVTYMIMDNGQRSPVYSNGDGTAYVDNGQGNVQLIQDANGNWVQLDPIQPQVQNIPVQTQPVVATPVAPATNNSGHGFFWWLMIISIIGIIGFFIWKIWYTGKIWF